MKKSLFSFLVFLIFLFFGFRVAKAICIFGVIGNCGEEDKYSQITASLGNFYSACNQGTAFTFYNNFSPNNKKESDSTVELYRFTLSENAREWHDYWGPPPNDLATQNLAIMTWASQLDNRAGNGLINSYDYRANSYLIQASNLPKEKPILTAPYSQVCDAAGVCNFIDQTIPEDVFTAYVAKIKNADYAFEVPVAAEDKAVYQIQSEQACPNSESFCWRYETHYFINYNSGRIPVIREIGRGGNLKGFYLTDADGNKIYAVKKPGFFQPWLIYESSSFQFEFPELKKNFDVIYSAASGYLNYNSGKIPVLSEEGKNYILDAAGNKIFGANNKFRINDTRLGAPLLVSHSIDSELVCPDSYKLLTFPWPWKRVFCWNPVGDLGIVVVPSESSPFINYNGGKIPVLSEGEKNYILDSAGNKIYSEGREFKLSEGAPNAQKFLVTYNIIFSNTYDSNRHDYDPDSKEQIFVDNYNGGRLIGGGPIYTFSDYGDYYNEANGFYFWLGGKEYKSGGYGFFNQRPPASASVLVDEYRPASKSAIVHRSEKFLSAVSGKPVYPTTVNSTQTSISLSRGNGVLGPFRPINDLINCPLPGPLLQSVQTCTSVTLESNIGKKLNVLRRVKGGGASYNFLQTVDFSLTNTFVDSGLTPHTAYEYALQDPSIIGSASLSPPLEAYTSCRPKCKVLSGSLSIPKFGSANFAWQCESDPALITCGIQSDDPGQNVLSGLSSSGSVKISPAKDSNYTLVCGNLDGSVAQPPVKVKVFQPGIREIKP